MSDAPEPQDRDDVGPPIHATPDGSSTVAPPWTWYRKLPPAVAQKESFMCWAAATESWLTVTPGHGDPDTQQDLAGLYGTKPTGGLDPLVGLPALAADRRMDWETIEAKKLKAQFIADRLRDFGHVLLIYNVDASSGIRAPSHTHLVYGIGYPNGRDLMVSVMDPDGGKYANHPLSFYKDKGAVIVVWPKRPQDP